MTQGIEKSEFSKHNRKEIVFILEDMVKHHTALNIGTPDGNSFLSSVLEVDVENDLIYLDISPDDRINSKIIASRQVTFFTHGGVEIRWHGSDLELVTLTDGDAFFMPIPKVIERIQRREYFRLNTPQGSKTLICKIPVDKEFYNAPIVDMSVGGIGLSIKGTPPAFISQGAILEECSVYFPEIGPVPLTLKVFSAWPSSKTKSGEQMYHIGLGFEKLTGRASNIVQRYMVQLELERIGRA
jgi:c-di-GMP-binding flagellar brake protein YcgR